MHFVKGMARSWKSSLYIYFFSYRDATRIWNSTNSMGDIPYLFQKLQSQGRCNRVLGKFPEKVPGSLGANPSQVQRSQEKVAEQVSEKVLGIFGAGSGQDRVSSAWLHQNASERFVKIKRCGCWGYRRSLFFKRTAFLFLQNVPYLFKMWGTLPGRCSTVWRKWSLLFIKSVVSSCSCFARKTCSIEANTTLSLSVAQPVKIEFHFSLISVDYIQYFTAKMTAFQHISTKLNFPSWLTGLLSSPCSFVLSDVQTWICTVCTQDLKPKVLTQYTPIKNNIAF